MDFTAIFQAIAAFFGFATKVIPTDKIREDLHQIKKPRLEENEKVKIYNKAYIRLKDHPEINIETDVKFNYDNLNEDDQKELIELLTDRITAYRKKHPIIFNKWLKQNNLK